MSVPRRSSKPNDQDHPRLGRECDREWHDYSIPANPQYAMLCAQSVTMWTAGAEPEEIARWLESKQDGCPVDLRDLAFAIRGLKPYRGGSALGRLFERPRPNDPPPAAEVGLEMEP